MAKRRLSNIFSGVKTAVKRAIGTETTPTTSGTTPTSVVGTRSVYTKDYVGGGAEVVKTSTIGGTTTTSVETDRTSSGGYITPTTTTTVTSPTREVISQQTTVAQPSYYDVKTVTDLRTQSQKQQRYYQDVVNRGGNIEQANRDLNKNIQEYQRDYYRQQGYNVTETNGQLQLQREIKQPKQIQEPIIEPKKNIFQKINTFVQKGEREGYRDELGNVIVKKKEGYVSKPLSLSLGTALGNTKWWKEKVVPYLKEKHPEMEQGKFTSGFFSVGGKKTTIDLKKTYTGLNSFNKWVGFSPLMATGTVGQQIQDEQGELIYDYTQGKWLRRNRITGQLTPANTKYTTTEIIKSSPVTSPPTLENGALGRYIVRYGGKSYYVSSTGKLVPVKVIEEAIKPATILTPKITPVIKPTTSSAFVETGTPSMVGGTGLKVLPKPSGFFEVTIEMNRLPSNIKYAGVIGGLTSWLSPQQTKTKQQTIIIPKQTSAVVPISKLGLTPLVTSKYKSSLGQPQPQISLQRQPQPQIQPQVPIVIQAQPSILKIRQPQLLKQPQGYKQVPRLKQPELFKPEKKGKQVVEFFKKPSSTKNIFESFLKRRGKDISLGKFGDIGSAKTKFLKEVKTTLGASGFITKNKEVIPLKELNLGYEFIPSKKQPLFRAVQRRGFRLSSRGEVTEIMGSKKKKERKLKWL